jgi:rubredoxin---NAD+ reductase
MDAPLVIIGSGLAGYSLAREFRRVNQERDIIMLTHDDGAYYSKPQLSTALAKQQTAAQLVMKSREEMAAQLNLTIIPVCRVERLDCAQHKIICATAEYVYSQCVLAVGAAPIHIPFAGDAVESLIAVNNITDYAQFQQWLQGKRHIGILGTGLVGCELMNDLLSAGYAVSMISLDDYPLQRFIPVESMGRACQQVYVDSGVNWHLQQSVVSIDHQADDIAIRLANGETVVVDGVISAVGLAAQTELAQGAGIETNKGILVNHYGQTSDPDVFALGDCAEIDGCLYQYVAPILHSARALASTLNQAPTAIEYPPMPVIIKTTRCPVISQLPNTLPQDAQWQLEGDANNQVAKLCVGDKLIGFVLMGDAVKTRAALMKQLSAAVKSV